MASSDQRAATAQRWRARWLARRNRLLASPGFQRLAAAFPPTRPIARRRAAELFDLLAGFVYAQTAHALVASGLFDTLSEAPPTLSEAARAAGLPEEGALRLLKAAASLKLAERIGDRWMLGTRGAALAGNPGARAMIVHHRLLYADLLDPLALLARRGGATGLRRFWDYSGRGAGEAAPYSELMAATQPMVARQAIAAYRFGRHRRMLDVGGGAGSFVAAVAGAAPALRFGLFDLPPVLELARERLAGLASRVDFHAGDFRTDSLPPGHDLITLVRILHDHDDPEAAALLAGIRRALAPGGRLLIVEPMAGTPGAEAMGEAYFGFYLWAMGQGRPRTAREIGAMLEAAGFSSWRLLPTRQPLIARVLLAS
ncbi:MAG: methyltransferase [Sphingomonadaceae bacterium]